MCLYLHYRTDFGEEPHRVPDLFFLAWPFFVCPHLLSGHVFILWEIIDLMEISELIWACERMLQVEQKHTTLPLVQVDHLYS